ncbi:Cytochrome P450 2B11 [Termitomyces sp. J132]|nr:Cytochrome P450 2B11 [Termitomyces sp. J132]
MLDTAPWLVAATVLLLVALGFSIHIPSKANRGLKLPPGPPGVPLLGSLLDVPGKHLATYFRRLLHEYGGFVSLNLVGFRLILIGDIKLAKELLEKRAAKYSSRPVVHYIRYHVDPVDAYWLVSQGGQNHAIARKLSHGIMSNVRAGKTDSLHEFEAALNIQKLLDDGGKEWFNHMNRIAASSVFAAAFGMHCPTGQESELKDVLNVNAEAVVLLAPSASIVNALPFLDLLPGPMPWRTRAQKFRKREDIVYGKLIDEAVRGKASGMNTWAAEFAREDRSEGDRRILLKQFTGAAIETTSSLLQSFVLACIRYPEWIATAQMEIDMVVGTDRLPSLKDRPFLPYMEAIVRVRFGIPHQSVADDVIQYQGQQYFIPEGSVIFPVTWAIEHDQSIFEDHDRFVPERFLDAKGNLKPHYETSAFGFGRRVCPGIPFAERTLWINIATMLWTFNIRKSDELDPKIGLTICYDDSDAAFTGDLTSSPHPFPAVFEPRSPRRTEIARREWDECEKDLHVLLPKE